MMNLRDVILGVLPFMLSLWVWVKDGYRFAFWLTSVEEKKEVPIIEGMPEHGTQTQIIWKDQFISGIETPLIGLIVSLFLFVLLYIKLRRS